MKFLFSILLAVAGARAWAGVPDVLVGFHNSGTQDFPGGSAYFTMTCHTSYDGISTVFGFSPVLPAIRAKSSAIVDIVLPQSGYNRPNLDWVQLNFFGGQQRLFLLQSTSLRARQKVRGNQAWQIGLPPDCRSEYNASESQPDYPAPASKL